jgi:hypothetical protein
MRDKAHVGSESTQDHKDPKKPVATPPEAKPVEGNTPVDRQETQEEHDARRPIDQP